MTTFLIVGFGLMASARRFHLKISFMYELPMPHTCRMFSTRSNPPIILLSRAILVGLLCGTFLCSRSCLQAQTVVTADNSPFDPREVGTTSDTKTIHVRFDPPLRFGASIVLYSDTREFDLSQTPQCSAPQTAECSIQVKFQPLYPGQRSASLFLFDNYSNLLLYSTALRGLGLAPQAVLTPGIIATAAGTGTSGFSGDYGPAADAALAYRFQ
jgi:hypothetical protein